MEDKFKYVVEINGGDNWLKKGSKKLLKLRYPMICNVYVKNPVDDDKMLIISEYFSLEIIANKIKKYEDYKCALRRFDDDAKHVIFQYNLTLNDWLIPEEIEDAKDDAIYNASKEIKLIIAKILLKKDIEQMIKMVF